MTFSHFFDLSNDYNRRLLTTFLSFNELVRLFVADRSPHFQLNMLIALLEKGKTTEEIDIVTVFLMHFFQQRQNSTANIKPLIPALHASLHSPNTTLAHQLAGKFLLSGQSSLPYSEALLSNLRVILEAMPTHPELAKAAPLLFIAGDERLQEAILHVLQDASLSSEIFTTWQLLLSTQLNSRESVTRPSAQTPRSALAANTLAYFFSTGKIKNSSKDNLPNTAASLPEALRIEDVNAFVEQLHAIDSKIFSQAASALGHLLSTPAAFLDPIRAQAVRALAGGLEDANQEIRKAAVEALFHILQAPVLLPDHIRIKAASALVGRLQDKNSKICSKAADALGHILSTPAAFLNPIRTQTVSALVGRLHPEENEDENKHKIVRYSAVTALSSILSAPVFLPESILEEGIDALLEQLNTSNNDFCKAITDTLVRILSAVWLPETQRIRGVDALLEILSDDIPIVRCQAAKILGGILLSTSVSLPEAKRVEIVNKLFALLHDVEDEDEDEDEDEEKMQNNFRCQVADVLGDILMSASISLPENIRTTSIDELLGLLHDENGDFRCKVLGVLGNILSTSVSLPEAKRIEGIDALLGLLLSNNENADYARVAVARVLGNILSASVSLPEAKRAEGVDALLAVVMDDAVYDITDHGMAILSLKKILSASVSLPEAKREETINALLDKVNGHTFILKVMLIIEGLMAILNAIVAVTTKNPTPNKTNLPLLSEDAKANIVTQLFLKTKGMIKIKDWQKLICWDKGMRPIISAATPASSKETKQLNAIIGIVEACESAPAQVLQITDPSEVDEELPRASFKP